MAPPLGSGLLRFAPWRRKREAYLRMAPGDGGELAAGDLATAQQEAAFEKVRPLFWQAPLGVLCKAAPPAGAAMQSLHVPAVYRT